MPQRWICRSEAPPFYPNLITLDGASREARAVQHSAIEELQATALPVGWAVKDSFHALDLSSHGFDMLFEANWIVRAPAAPAVSAGAMQLSVVTDDAALADWERAWRADCGLEDDETPARMFPESMLAEPDILFLGARCDGQIVAGAAVHSGAGVVGITNLFHGAEPADVAWAGTVAALSHRFPAMAMVGYEPVDTCDMLRGLGFRELGSLAVWISRG